MCSIHTMSSTIALTICSVLLSLGLTIAATKSLSPVILIPGIAGNQLEAKLNMTKTAWEICTKRTTGFMNMWVNVKLLLPFYEDCWVEYMSLVYDNETRTTRDNVGVVSRVPGWGSPDVTEWLSKSRLEGPYFAAVAKALVKKGYVRNKSLRGAPYDFRKGPNENGKFFVDLKILVEQTYAMNDNRSVTLIVHSMGGPMTLLFLQRQTADWKNKYIARVISLAGAWAGSVKPLLAYTFGDDFEVYLIRRSIIRKEEITNPSTAWMLPSSQLWRQDAVLVTTPTKNYTLGTLRQFFNDLPYPNAWEMYSDLKQYDDLRAPGVELHCIFGTTVDTIDRLDFSSSDLLSPPKFIYGDGDGSVNIRSLRVCERWNEATEQLGKSVTLLERPGVSHMQILQDKTVLRYVEKVLQL